MRKIFSLSACVAGIAIFAIVFTISCSKEKASNTSNLKACGTCNWYGTNYPVCCSTTSGWGYEGNVSCISKATCTGSGQSCSGCSSLSSSSSSSLSSSSSSSGSCPGSVSCPSGVACGCYTVSGLAANKQAVGSNQSFESAAMMETELMNTNYTTGDGKSGDAFNAGRTKLNYYEARMAGVGQGSTSALWNKCLSGSSDVSVWNSCKSYWGSCYWDVHRNGNNSSCSGSSAMGWKDAMDWTYNNLSGHTSDNVRFWCNIPSC